MDPRQPVPVSNRTGSNANSGYRFGSNARSRRYRRDIRCFDSFCGDLEVKVKLPQQIKVKESSIKVIESKVTVGVKDEFEVTGQGCPNGTVTHPARAGWCIGAGLGCHTFLQNSFQQKHCS